MADERPASTNRKCLSCGAIVAAWPNIMTCHCRAIPWAANADGCAVAMVSEAIKPILKGCIDPHTKDDFDWWVGRLTNDVARAAIASMPTVVTGEQPQGLGVPASPSGHSRAEPEEVSALRASVPNALLTQCLQAIEFYALPENWHGVYMCGHGPMVDDWADDYDDHQYPDGKPGKLAREAWRALSDAGFFASAIEAPWVETVGLDAEHENAVANGETPTPSSAQPGDA